MPPTGSSRPRMRASLLLLRACFYLPVVLLPLAASTSPGDVSIAPSRGGDDRTSRRGAGGGDVFEAGRLGDAPPVDGVGGGAPDAAGGGEGGRRSSIRRRLEDVRFDGSCHESVLVSTRIDVTNEDVYTKGLFFSVENDGTVSMSISAVSVYLANTAETFDFSLYQRGGRYMPLYANGTIQDMFLPGNLTVDWQSVAAGTGVNLGNFTTDEDGASLVPFESFGGSGVVTLGPGDLRSFFIVFSTFVVAVDEVTVDDTIESIEGESPDGSVNATEVESIEESLDGSVNVTEGYDGLKMYVGRKFIWSDSPDSQLGSQWGEPTYVLQPFDLVFYEPARFLGKLWSSLACPPSLSPTAHPSSSLAPTSSIPTASPSEAPTPPTEYSAMATATSVNVANITLRMYFNATLEGQVELLSQADLKYAEDMLERHALGVYARSEQGGLTVYEVNITITGYIDESSNGSAIKILYDQEMVFDAAEYDDTTVPSIIEMPLATDEDRSNFTAKLKEGGSVTFGSLNGVDGIIAPGSQSLSPPTSSPNPSFVPSAAPTSYHPTSSPSGSSSEKPSFPPSLMPIESPYLIPSVSPTQYAAVASSSQTWSSSIDEVSIENLDVTYSFDILFLPANQAQVEEFVKGNVTQSLRAIFGNSSEWLSRNKITFSSTIGVVSINEDADPNCVSTGDNYLQFECKRFDYQIFFQYERNVINGVTEGTVRGQLLEVSDRIMGTLIASYSGDEAVRSGQTMLFRNVTKIIVSTQEIARVRIAAVVLDELRNSREIQQSNFMILDVVCLGYIPKPSPATQARGLPLFKTRYRGLRRQLEQIIGGDLEVNIEITGEYSTARRSDEVSADVAFNDLVEDSINRVGNNIGATLKERDILVMEGEVTSQTVVITLVPTPTPIEPKSIAPPPNTTKSNFASSSIGITGIVTTLVVFVVAGFLFYRALRSRKIDNKDMSWDEDDFSDSSSYQKNTNQKNTIEAHNVVEEMPTPRTSKIDDPPNARPAHYSGSSGPPVDSLDALPAHYAPVRLSGMHGAFQPLDRGLNQTVAEDRQNLVHDEEHINNKVSSRKSQRQLDDFETRVQKSRSDRLKKKLSDGRLLRSEGSVSSFEDRLKQKLSGSNYSSRHVKYFEARLAAKIKEGESSRSTQGVHPSSSSSEDFDARMKKKLSNSNPRRSPGRYASSYEDRLEQKLSNSIVPPRSRENSEERPVAKIKGGEARRSTHDTFPSLSSSEDFESRLAAKIKKGERNRSRDASSGTGLALEDRLTKKLGGSNEQSSGGSVSSFEDRLKQKLSDSNDSSRHVEDFEARLTAKIKEGEKNKSSDGPILSYEDRLEKKLNECHTRKISGGSLSSFEDKLKNKLLGSSLGTPLSSSPRDLNYSTRISDSFEERIAAKMKEGEKHTKSTSGALPSYSSSLTVKEFEARLAAKIKKTSREESPSASNLSYEDRSKKKLGNVSSAMPSGGSPGDLNRTDSVRRLDRFEELIAAKLKKG